MEQPDAPINNEGESTNIFTDMGTQLMKLVSPTKKGTKKGLRVATLPKESGGSITRRTAQRTNLKVPEVFGPEWSRRGEK